MPELNGPESHLAFAPTQDYNEEKMIEIY